MTAQRLKNSTVYDNSILQVIQTSLNFVIYNTRRMVLAGTKIKRQKNIILDNMFNCTYIRFDVSIKVLTWRCLLDIYKLTMR